MGWLSLLVSLVSLVLSAMAYRDSRRAIMAGERLDEMGEKNVRTIMDEGGEASVHAVLRTFSELKKGGLLPEDAIEQAREICKR